MISSRGDVVHTGVCVCISSAGRQCPGAGSGLPSSTDGGGACQFVEPRARASCWALRHLRKTQMATRMMTRACAESSRHPRAVDASIDVCAGPYDDGEDHGPGDARLALLARVAAALLAPAARALVGRGVGPLADPEAPGRVAHGVARAVAQAVLRRLARDRWRQGGRHAGGALDVATNLHH